MSLAAADVQAVEGANTPAKARALLVKLAAERKTATPERQAQIDAATAIIRQAFAPEELRAQTPSSKAVTPPRQPGTSPAQPGKTPRPKTTPAQPAPSPARAPRARRAAVPRRARRAGRRVVNEAVGHAEPAGQIALTILGASLAFAVLYAVLRNAGNAPRGKAAIEIAGSGAVAALNRFIAPVDPLAPSKTPTQAAVAAAAKRPSTQPTRTHTTTKPTKPLPHLPDVSAGPLFTP